ncbi:MAG: hypothetical protein K5Q00_00880, partial [Gammaproteobacteria bacterium]|nr:hypothetical protein [Gammaproteobacteria bacterium]
MRRIVLAIFFLVWQYAAAVPTITITQHDAQLIGAKILLNETGGNPQLLTWWGQGSDFASMGIGNFAWYPNGVNDQGFFMLFPQYLNYAKQNGGRLPSSLQSSPPCPWNSRQAFNNAIASQTMVGMQQFLLSTVDLQTLFIAHSINQAIPTMLNTLSGEQHRQVEKQLENVLATNGGVYAVIDYTTFKGLGLDPRERYQGQGWGLLQVLQNMKTQGSGPQAIEAFTASAEQLLRRRVE